MALSAAGVLAQPDQACIGSVKSVSAPYLSKSGVYHVLPIEIEGKYAAPKTSKFYFIFEPRWFGSTFDPKELLAEGTEGQKKYGMYRRAINGGRNAILAAILGDQFDNFAAEFDSLEEPSLDEIGQIIRKYLVGVDTLYVMKQRVDEGELTEQYNITGFYPYTQEQLDYFVEQSQNENRKTPLVVTWDVE